MSFSMDHHPAAPQTCVLKMHSKCEKCQRQVKRALQRVHGVHSISIDSNEGRIAVTSTVDPQQFIAMLAKASKKADLMWEPKPPPPPPQPLLVNNPNPHHQHHHSGKTEQIGGGNAHHHHHQNDLQLAQLQELAKNRRLKNLEITHSRNIKMTFRDHDDDSNQDHVEKIIMDLENGIVNETVHVNPPPPPTNQCGGAGPSSGVGTSRCVEEPIRPPSTPTTNQCGGAGPSSGVGTSKCVEEPFRPPPNCGYNPYHNFPPNYYPHRETPLVPPPENPPVANVSCGDDNCSVM